MGNKWIKVYCLSMAVLITSVTAMCFINPAIAHDDNITSWNGLIKGQTEAEEAVSSNWLSKEGQTVIINNYSNEYSIPITIVSSSDITGATISAVSDNAEALSITLSQEKFDLKEGQEQTVNLTMSVNKSLADKLENVSDALSSVLDEESESTEVSDGEESEVTVNIECVYGSEKLSAVLVVPLVETTESNLAEGNLSKIQSQYNKALPINLTTGDKAVKLKLNEGNFPSKTRYSVDGKSTILFDEGVIYLEADKDIKLDLSQTDISGDIVINTTESEYDLVDTALVLNADYKSFIIKGNLELPVSYLWGSIEPEIKTEHLTVSEDKLIWAENKSVTCEKSTAGNILLKNNNAEAGTYKITVSWIENNVTLYEIEIPFFVRYDSAALGGTGQ